MLLAGGILNMRDMVLAVSSPKPKLNRNPDSNPNLIPTQNHTPYHNPDPNGNRIIENSCSVGSGQSPVQNVN